MEDWVLDSLVGFLKSPMWNDPVSKFIDRNCVVFDPGEENKFSYTDVHREYQKLVEDLLEGFTTDLGITADQFTQACSQLQTSKAGQENEELFEQVLAADDFLLFKEAMVHKNIDLELQALTLLQKQMGHSPSAYDKDRAGEQPGAGGPKTSQQRLEEEERVLKEVMKLSEAQYKLECSMAEWLEQAKVESLQMYRQSQQQKDRDQGGEMAVGQEESGEQQITIGDGRDGKEGSGAAEGRELTGDMGGREGAPSKEREGALSKEREGPPSKEREGPPSKEREGAPSKEREGPLSKEREGAPSKEREGPPSKEREGAPSKEREGAPSKEREGAPSKEREGPPSKEREGAPSKEREGPPSKEREGAPSKEREGPPSKEREGAQSKEREGPPSKEREGAPSKEREGAPSKEREGAPSKEREGAPSKEREGPPSKEREGAPSKEREGPPSKEREGAPSKEREGAPSKEREGAPSKEREGAPSKEREGAPSKERAGTSSVHSEANGRSSESVVPQPWTATAGRESTSGGKSEIQPQATAATGPAKSKEETTPHVKILPPLVGQTQSLPAALGTVGEVKSGTTGEVKSSASESGDMLGADAVARWLQGARSDQHADPNAARNRAGNAPSTPASGPTPEQLRAREQYLRKQRDRLLEMKKQQRSHGHKAGSDGSSRFKSPQGAQEADKAGKTGAGGVGGKERGGGGGGRGGRGGGRHGRDTGVLSSAIVGSLKKV